jgi:hypothetical protein
LAPEFQDQKARARLDFPGNAAFRQPIYPFGALPATSGIEPFFACFFADFRPSWRGEDAGARRPWAFLSGRSASFLRGLCFPLPRAREDAAARGPLAFLSGH